MNEYTLVVDFKKKDIKRDRKIKLVENDYNSTKFNFEFDSIYDNYTKVFELKYPSGKKWIKEIIDNEVILADKDENGNLVSILIESSDYQYEIVLYDANSKLTHSAIGEFEVREELVKTTDKEIELDDRLPILDQLIQKTIELKEGYDNLDVDVEKTDTKSTITITKTDGTSESVEILDGKKGDKGFSPIATVNQLEYGVKVSVTDEEGTTEAEIFNGTDGYTPKKGTDYFTEEEQEQFKEDIEEKIKPTLDNNLELAKDYADSIKPTKTSELNNDSNFAKTNSNNNFSASQTVNGTLTVNGNIVQNGESYETHAEQVYTKNDEIVTRDGAVGGLVQGQLTGIRAKKYDGENDGQLGFDANGEARVGDVGDTQPLLTRDEINNLVDGQVLIWDGTKLRAVGSSNFIKNTDIASLTNFGVVKTWTSTNEDGEIGLNISTEV